MYVPQGGSKILSFLISKFPVLTFAMIRFIACLIALISSFASFAQTGNYLMTHYSPKNEEIDHVSFDIAQDNRGVLFFANKAGILEFDGRNWNMIKTPAPVYTISVTPDGRVYGGGLSGFGRVVTSTSKRVTSHLPDPRLRQIIFSQVSRLMTAFSFYRPIIYT